MSRGPGKVRELQLSLNENLLERGHKQLTNAIGSNLGPSQLSMQRLDYEDEEFLLDLAVAMTRNTVIRRLDMSKGSLPMEASDDTCKALERMLALNTTLQELDISGEDSKLEFSKLGTGINKALQGLKVNQTLEVFRVQHQKLGARGAATLSDVIAENRTLRELHCNNNQVTLGGFTDMVNAMAHNKTLLYLSAMTESRDEALRQTELQVRSPKAPKHSVRKTFASITSKAHRSISGSTQLSEQEIDTALGMVSDSWKRQWDRLARFLQRNHNIAQGFHDGSPTEYGQHKEDDRVGSPSTIIERVKLETTPTMEKQLQLGDRASADGQLRQSPNEDPNLQRRSPVLANATASPDRGSSGDPPEIPRALVDLDFDFDFDFFSTGEGNK